VSISEPAENKPGLFGGMAAERFLYGPHKEALDQKWSGASLWGCGRTIFFGLVAITE
jgi:hypothetical protein